MACSYRPMAIHEGRASIEAQQVAPVLERRVNHGGHWSLASALGENAKLGVTEKAMGKVIVCPPAVPFPPCIIIGIIPPSFTHHALAFDTSPATTPADSVSMLSFGVSHQLDLPDNAAIW